MKHSLVILALILSSVSSYAQAGRVEHNFVNNSYSYRNILVSTDQNVYGQQHGVQLMFIGARFYPLPDFPNDVVKDKQDALCGTLKVSSRNFLFQRMVIILPIMMRRED